MAEATGFIGAADQAVMLRSGLSFSEDYLSGLPNVAQIFTSGYESGGRVNFNVAVRGTLKKPEIILEKK